MSDLSKKLLLLGLGALNLTEEKIKNLVQDLEKRGEITEKEAKGLAKELSKRAQEGKKKLQEKVDETLRNTIKKMDLSSRKEVEGLKKKVSQLSKKIDQMKRK